MCTLVRMSATPAVAGPRSMRERMLADDPEPAGADAAAPDLVAAHDATTARRRPLRRQLPVAVGADTVVGAGSVVTRDLQAGVGAVGHPARVVRTPESP